jgi:hypothetical protein
MALSAPGETKWAVQIGPDGRVVSVRQMLTVEEFGMARVGEWTMQDVLVHFGKPTDSTYFPLMRRKVWSYPVRRGRSVVLDHALLFRS